MPEAAVHEDRHAGGGQHEICDSGQRGQWTPMDSETEPAPVRV